MPNRNPWQGRLSKKRRRKAGDLEQLQKVLWSAIMSAEATLYGAVDAELVLKAVHAIAQASSQYAKLLEVGELEARLSALEERLERRSA